MPKPPGAQLSMDLSSFGDGFCKRGYTVAKVPPMERVNLDGLRRYLNQLLAEVGRVFLTFEQVEEAIGSRLPSDAQSPDWWAGAMIHGETNWEGGGWEVEDVTAEYDQYFVNLVRTFEGSRTLIDPK